MKKSLLLVLGIALSAAANAAISANLIEAAGTAVLKIRAHDSEGNVTRGSAVSVSQDTLVTNCHVIRGAQRIEAIQGRQAHAAALRAEYSMRDLCYLHAPGITGHPPAYPAEARIGQRIFSVCFPSGGELAIAEGRVVALHEYDGAKIIQGSAPFEPGCSGGALLDEQGRLVGITTFKCPVGGPFHFSLPAAWLTSARDGDNRPAANFRPAFWQLDVHERPEFLKTLPLNTSSTN